MLGANPLVLESTSSISRIVRDVAHLPHEAMGGVTIHATCVGAVGSASDRFEVKRKLGQGGFGVVYEAFDKTRKSLVALKALERIDGDRLYRFKKEFRALSGIVHPNLVRLHELFAIDGHTRPGQRREIQSAPLLRRQLRDACPQDVIETHRLRAVAAQQQLVYEQGMTAGFDGSVSAVARRRTGVLVGGDEGRVLVESADSALRAECVKVPERIADVYAPGLAPR